MGLVYAFYTAELDEAQAKLFPASIDASIAAARNALEGTLLYDAFQSPDGSIGTMIEAYDSSEAMVRHVGALAKAANPPPQTKSSSLTLLGDVSEDLKAKFARFGATYYGPLKMGVMADRVKSGQAPVSAESVMAFAWFKAPAGRWDEFWELAKDSCDGVRDHEPDTLAYEWFMSEKGDEAFVLDVYKDIPALKHHSANSRPKMAKIFAMVEKARVHLHGGVPEEMIGPMTAQPGRAFHGRRLAGLV